MILQTGGRESATTSTRSSPASWASRMASDVSTTPICSLSAPISRTGVIRIRWFTRVRLIGPTSL